MFDHPKFKVALKIQKITRIPYSAGSVFVRWNVTDSPRPDAHGRTSNKPINQSEVLFNYSTTFHQRIGMRSQSRELKSCMIKFEVMWIPEGNHIVNMGVLNLNLAEFAAKSSTPTPKSKPNNLDGMEGGGLEDDSACGRRLLYILSGARTNCLLQVQIEVIPISSEADFTVPMFSGPAVNFTSETAVENQELGSAPNLNSSDSRDKIRTLRKAVLTDLHREEDSKNAPLENLDLLLLGKPARVVPDIAPDEYEKYHIHFLGDDPEIRHPKEVRPYEEIELRDSFSTWKEYK